MVQLTEVMDEHFQEGQVGPEDDEDFTDTGQWFCLFSRLWLFSALCACTRSLRLWWKKTVKPKICLEEEYR